MKPISRRNLIASLAALAVTFGLLLPTAASAQSDPLPSWNDGPAKQAIVNFVKATTDQSNPDFVPPEERIATFDQDGTLWVEHPIYTQVEYCLERVRALVKAKPELANVEPFKTVMSGDREAIAKLSMPDLEKILYATLTGMTVDDFNAEVAKWIATAKDARWKRPYTELTYQPMQEVLSYLRASGFKTYIVTGGGQDFVRVYSERVYGIPPEQVVGTMGGTSYGYKGSHSPRRGEQPWVDESGCRPGSVPCRRCRRRGDGHPSRVAVADHLQRPTRVLGRAALERTLSGLAPDGVYQADLVAQVAGGLLHHRFTLAPAARAPGAVCSLWHCPAGRPGWLLATILPFGARTFLGGGCPPTRPSARLVRRQCRGARSLVAEGDLPGRSRRRGRAAPTGGRPAPRGRR